MKILPKKLIIIAIFVSLIMSIRFLLKSSNFLYVKNESFIDYMSLLFSNITTMVVLMYLLRQYYNEEKTKPKLLYSKYSMFLFLIYIVFCFSFFMNYIFQFGFNKGELLIQQLLTIFFALFCIVSVIFMLRKGNKTNNVV